MHTIPRCTIVLFFVLLLRPASGVLADDLMGLLNNATKFNDVVVTEVLSTDTIKIEVNTHDGATTVRLIGLKAPEPPAKIKERPKRDQHGFTVKKDAGPMTPVDEQAFDFVNELLLNRHVRLEFDVEKRAEEFQTLAYVYLLENNMFVNAEILRHGFAHLQISPPNTKHAEKLRAAYREARKEKRGLQGQ